MLSIILFAIVFNQGVGIVHAWVGLDPPTTVTGVIGDGAGIAGAGAGAVGAGAGTAGTAGTFTQIAATLAKKIADSGASWILSGLKMAALLIVQKATQALIGEGGGGVVTDWGKYMYNSPQQAAMVQMNSFFNTVSKGRLSSLNYEGVGPNIDSYLVGEAKKDIAGRSFNTTLPEITPNQKQLFASGNMKGIMTYMQCANNVACYTLNSTAKYNLELEKAKKVAEMSQDRGFLPVKNKNGKITQPAAVLSSALTQVDQLGTQVIMNADTKTYEGLAGASFQIVQGALISIASRSFNYMTADSKGKEEIRNKNDEFPFSAGYSAVGGIGFSAGGINVNTGAGAVNGSVMIGNTCASLGATAAASGATVDINGKRYNCATKLEVGATAPSVSVTLPSITGCKPPAGDLACFPGKCGPAGTCIPK
ncbi:MAG: hypothetical protein WCI36_01075 [bacterium]